ncbi:hypothetical protein IAD21_06375 [Abditibacteriota bacterium]|nr:hypothetical protein IAD21_06375 [Abditibacteriota bacterium]
MRLPSQSAKKRTGLPTSAQELLLTAALGDAESALSAWNLWRQQHELNNLDNDSLRLLPLVGYNLSKAGIKFPEMAAITALTRLGWARHKFLFRSISEVAQLLTEHRIDFLLTKGLPLALEHYPSSALRPMSDGDILVRLTQFDRAIELLVNAGWRHASEYMPSPAHHAIPLRNATHQEVDVHRFALGECPFAREDEAFWRFAVTLSIDGVSALSPNPTDLLFLTCANSVHSPLRWVADAVILVRGNEIDWNRFINQARKRKLALVTRNALSYIEQRYSAGIPSWVLKSLQAIPVSWLERWEYEAWDKTSSHSTRLLLRYAAYRRVPGAQHPLGFLNHLRLHGNLNSVAEIPSWLLRIATQKPRTFTPETTAPTPKH